MKSLLVGLVISFIFMSVGGALIWMWFGGIMGEYPLLDVLGFGALFALSGFGLFVLTQLRLIFKSVSFKRSIRSVDEAWLVGVAKISNVSENIFQIGRSQTTHRGMRTETTIRKEYVTIEYEYSFVDDIGKQRKATAFIKENKIFDAGIDWLVAKHNFTYYDEDLKNFIIGHNHNEDELEKSREFWTFEYIKEKLLHKIDDAVIPRKGDSLRIVFNKTKSFVIGIEEVKK